MSLRPRQQKAISDITDAYKLGYRAPVLIAPTGFGKTHTSATIIRRALARGKSVWFLAHLKEILGATADKLKAEQIPHGWIAAGAFCDRRQPVQVAMVQTLVRRLERFAPPDLLIVDEAHLAVAQTYQTIFEWAGAGPKFARVGGAKLLHLTATPQRLDGRGLGEVADILIPTCGTAELIAEGLLAPIRYYAPDAPDMGGVRTVAGEFNQRDAAGTMDKPRITGSAVAHYRKLAHGRPAIAFCVSISHAQHVAAEFRAAGYRAVAISGESDARERDQALRDLQSGALDVVCNCALWVAGVDAPAVSCIILLAPTQSVTKYLQSVGRGLRTHPGKSDCVILDHAGNVMRHGLPTDEREWTLDGAVRREKRESFQIPLKRCPMCAHVVSSAATQCRCGHIFAPQARVIEQVEGELQEIDLSALHRERMREQGKAQTLDDLIAVGRQRGMKNPAGWARHVMRARAAKNPARAFA